MDNNRRWSGDIHVQPPDSDTERILWVDGSFQSPAFYIGEQGSNPLEIEADSIDIPSSQQDAILGMIWEWEVWEPVTEAGTCAIESLERIWSYSVRRCLIGSEEPCAIQVFPTIS
jgi:hypothetical protein